MALTRAGAKDGTDMGSRWIFVAIPSVRLETGADRRGLTEDLTKKMTSWLGLEGFIWRAIGLPKTPVRPATTQLPFAADQFSARNDRTRRPPVVVTG